VQTNASSTISASSISNLGFPTSCAELFVTQQSRAQRTPTVFRPNERSGIQSKHKALTLSTLTSNVVNPHNDSEDKISLDPIKKRNCQTKRGFSGLCDTCRVLQVLNGVCRGSSPTPTTRLSGSFEPVSIEPVWLFSSSGRRLPSGRNFEIFRGVVPRRQLC